jgi:pyrroloquinoline quinone (PQQ) biosynthesis protein C
MGQNAGNVSTQEFQPGAMRVCTIEALLGELSRPLEESVPAAAEILRGVEEAALLARAAYQEKNADAIATAERLLYMIHTQSAFAPPNMPIAATCWSILMGAKMKSCLSLLELPTEVGPDEMVERLDDAVKQVESRDHSFLDLITRQEPLRGLILYTKNWYASTHGFTNQLISMMRNCHGKPEFKVVQAAALENLEEEYEPEAPHIELRARWPRRLGLEYSPSAAITDADQVLEAFSLQNFRTGVSNLSDPTYVLGSFYTVEAAFPGVCSRMYEGLSKRGFDDHSLALFKSHAGTDSEHAEEWLRAIRDSPLSPQQRARVLRGGLTQIELRRQMFVAMREKL